MKALAAILLAGLAVAMTGGCSEDDDEPGRSVTIRPEETLDIEADEYRFDPERVRVKSAGRNVRLRAVLDNRGTLAHNLHVRDGERDIGGLRSFPPGEERALSVNLEPGEYDLVCTVADHEDLGMKGKLEIH